MPDFCDNAWEATQLHLAAALSARNTAAGRGPIWRGKTALCRVCGDEIPAARVEALPGAETCVECAREAESGN